MIGVINGGGVRVYVPDLDNRLLSPITEAGSPIGVHGEGFCLYESPVDQRVYGISITRAGILNQFELLDEDDDGLLEVSVVRTFAVGSEAEGCVADDTTGALYVSEEDVALWRYDAEPSGGTARLAVDVVASDGGQLAADLEGVTLVEQAGGAGYVVVSAQNVADPDASYFGVYHRETGNAFVGNFRITDGSDSDDCDRTDGIAATTADLGPAFPRGVFVCQDNNNDAPGQAGSQDLKLTPLETVVDLGSTPPPPPPPASPPGSPPPPSPTTSSCSSPPRATPRRWSAPAPAGPDSADRPTSATPRPCEPGPPPLPIPAARSPWTPGAAGPRPPSP